MTEHLDPHSISDVLVRYATGIGCYDDELVRTAGGWRFARGRFTAVRVSTVGSP